MSVPFQYQAPQEPGRKELNGENATISRRTLLRGAGVTLGLPWLEAMMPAARARPRRCRRIRCAWRCCTCRTASTRRALVSEGHGPRVRAVGDPRAARRLEGPDPGPEQSVERGREGRRRALCEGGRDPHLRDHQQDAGRRTSATACRWTSWRRSGPATRRRCLRWNSGMAPVAVGVDLAVGYTRIYGSHISWSNPTTPLPAR